jgi:hypothetical protein
VIESNWIARDPAGTGFLLDDPHGGFLFHVSDLVRGGTEAPASVGQLGGHGGSGVRSVEEAQETECPRSALERFEAGGVAAHHAEEVSLLRRVGAG